MRYLTFEDIIREKINSNVSVLTGNPLNREINTVKQISGAEANTSPQESFKSEKHLKTVLGFCRGSELPKSGSQGIFYFHVAEMNRVVRDFPDSILEADLLFLYSGGRAKTPHFTGHYAKIKSVQIKHKSNIKGKEHSNTEYYCEVKLESPFKRHKKINSKFAPELFFGNCTSQEFKFFQERLPALTTLDKILKLNGIQSL